MKSNVCKIENGTKDLDAILKESEKVAVYNDLTRKQSLQLRLICEEIDGMLPNIISDRSLISSSSGSAALVYGTACSRTIYVSCETSSLIRVQHKRHEHVRSALHILLFPSIPSPLQMFQYQVFLPVCPGCPDPDA